jgi:hypothetical protein
MHFSLPRVFPPAVKLNCLNGTCWEWNRRISGPIVARPGGTRAQFGRRVQMVKTLCRSNRLAPLQLERTGGIEDG